VKDGRGGEKNAHGNAQALRCRARAVGGVRI